LTADLVANASTIGLFARAAEPDHVGGLAALVIAEALVGGWEAMRRSGPEAAGVAASLRDRLTRWAAAAASLAPSPSLAAGLVGVQASLFHRASGWSFSTLDAGLSSVVFVAIAVAAWGWRLVLPEPSRRAAAAVPLFATLFVLGAMLTPWLDARPKGARPTEIDLRATASLAALTTACLALGMAIRSVRSRLVRKGADAS
jgi:hypothetical protein